MAKEKHPKGLPWLFTTELWERFAFYIIGPSLFLFMKDKLGFQSGIGIINGLNTGAVYLIPILGGWIADRWWGQVKTIKVGAFIMMLGFIFMMLAHDSTMGIVNFFVGLGLLALGTGFLKANISVLVGNLYGTGSKLKDAGFNIFYMGINIGAAASPILIGIVREKLKPWIQETFPSSFNEYNFCYLLGAVGMVIALIIFRLGKKTYIDADRSRAFKDKAKEKAEQEKANLPQMSREEEVQRMRSIAVLLAISVVFWFAFYQNYNALTDFANESTKFTQYEVRFNVDPDDPYTVIDENCPIDEEDPESVEEIHTAIDRKLAELAEFEAQVAAGTATETRLQEKFYAEDDPGMVVVTVDQGDYFTLNLLIWKPDFRFSAELFQSFNPIFIVSMTPLLVIFWGRMRKKKKEPSTPIKIMFGCFISALWPLVMFVGCFMGGNDGNHDMSPWWLIGAYFIVTVSELLFSPMGLSYMSKIAPPKWGGMLMGFWFGSVGIGGILSGFLYEWLYLIPQGATEPRISHHMFYLVVSIILGSAGLLAIVCKKQLIKFETE